MPKDTLKTYKMIFCEAKRRLLSTAQITTDAHIIQQVQLPQEIERTKT